MTHLEVAQVSLSDKSSRFLNRKTQTQLSLDATALIIVVINTNMVISALVVVSVRIHDVISALITVDVVVVVVVGEEAPHVHGGVHGGGENRRILSHDLVHLIHV